MFVTAYVVVLSIQQSHALCLYCTPPLSPPRMRFRGGHFALTRVFFGVRCYSTALESGDKSPHSKRRMAEKACF